MNARIGLPRAGLAAALAGAAIWVLLGAVARRGGAIGVCGTCMEARGIAGEELVEGTHRSTMEALADWTLWADRVGVF